MRRFAAAICFVFVTSLVLGSYGHCWPMLAAQIDAQPTAHDAHHDGGHGDGHQKPHHHPTQGFGQELSVPGVQAALPAVAHIPVVKVFVPVLPAIAILDDAHAYNGARPHPRARAGPAGFAEFRARTGRLLI